MTQLETKLLAEALALAGLDKVPLEFALKAKSAAAQVYLEEIQKPETNPESAALRTVLVVGKMIQELMQEDAQRLVLVLAKIDAMSFEQEALFFDIGNKGPQGRKGNPQHRNH